MKIIKIISSRLFWVSAFVAILLPLPTSYATEIREQILLDAPWRFALGHATDREKDFNHATGYFSYLAKTGYGDGPASSNFDDRSWRKVQLPHDWAVEMPIDRRGSHSHGYRAVGPGFPQNSVGWYRHHFNIPEADFGRRISIEFEGVQRAARVFVNGFFVGEQNLGNIGQHYDISAYLNYGGDNVVAVRADVSIEAGWYYEGAGINRNVWLIKTEPVHVARNGTFVSSALSNQNKKATLTIQTTIHNQNESTATRRHPATKLKRIHTIFDAQYAQVAQTKSAFTSIAAGHSSSYSEEIKIKSPQLWSIDSPVLYTLITTLVDNSGNTLDAYETTFGIRSIRFEANTGFYLNDKPIKIKGSNNHEDHAGVGTATPSALIEYRLKRLKSMGMNTYRASHAPASPDLLKAADKLGMLVVDETRLSGINAYHLDALEEMIKRGRNHPSIILWSLGNEEWAIEGNEKGARITQTMQSFARNLDPTRLNTVAISGGWGGSSTTVGVMGVNYIKHGNTDEQHKKYPWQILLGTEETTTQQTRGIYFENKKQGHLAPQEDGSSGGNAESGWQYYAARDYLAGIIYWTGFDYRGEPTPYEYPAVGSQFGILDSCGFAKDSYFYLKSWWTDEPVLHLFPHWNWPGREGEMIDVNVHSNAEVVELFLNQQSMGKKAMPVNGHLSWPVQYSPGHLHAVAWRNGQAAETRDLSTTGDPSRLSVDTHKHQLLANGHDLAVINISVRDAQGRVVPTANNELNFLLEGPGKIIGVGNGNPSSHEADVFVETVSSQAIGHLQAPPASESEALVTFETTFKRPTKANNKVRLLINALGREQSLWLNGKLYYQNFKPERAKIEIDIEELDLKPKNNSLKIIAKPFFSWSAREKLVFVQPASFAFTQAAPKYTRNAFNGWAQVLVQSTEEEGEIKLQVKSEGVTGVATLINSQSAYKESK